MGTGTVAVAGEDLLDYWYRVPVAGEVLLEYGYLWLVRTCWSIGTYGQCCGSGSVSFSRTRIRVFKDPDPDP
jgi:hypothetical protein